MALQAGDDGAIDPSATQQAMVGSIDDGIHVQLSDVCLYDLQHPAYLPQKTISTPFPSTYFIPIS